jgi:hypothetical protein
MPPRSSSSPGYVPHQQLRLELPDTARSAAQRRLTEHAGRRSGDPTMTTARIRDDLDRVVAATSELLEGSLTYEQSLSDYFPALIAAHGGDAGAIWSIDGVHFAYA